MSEVPGDATALMREAPEDQPARLVLAGDRIAAVAVALGPGSLPAAVRATVDAVAPRGDVVFRGREWSERGDGYRIVTVRDRTGARLWNTAPRTGRRADPDQ